MSRGGKGEATYLLSGGGELGGLGAATDGLVGTLDDVAEELFGSADGGLDLRE